MLESPRNRRSWRVASLLLAVPALIAGAAHAQAPPRPVATDDLASPSPDGSRILFQSRRDGFGQIYVMDTAGGEATRLTHAAANSGAPRYSPDGRWVAFESDRDGDWQIYRMRANGADQVRVTSVAGGARQPAWSQDGAEIFFIAPDGEGDEAIRQVWRVAADGRGAEMLTRSEGDKGQPAPGRSALAFVAPGPGGPEIWVVGADGADPRRITELTVDSPRRFINGLGWSAEGDELVFATNRGSRGRYFFQSDVYAIRPDGSGLRRINRLAGIDHNNPAVSADGSVIVFDAFAYGGRDVFVMDGDGSNERNLTRTSRTEFFAQWIDGDTVLFQSQRTGDRDIYVMRPDGTGVRNLTHHKSDDRAPSYARAADRIVFASFRDSDWGDIYTMRRDGTDVRKVTPDGFFEELDQFPIATTVTADGNRILFESAPVLVEGEAHWDIWAIDADGSDARRLTSSPGTSRSGWPVLSPDDRSFAFHADPQGDFEVFRMDLDGSNLVRLTDREGFDGGPRWAQHDAAIYYGANVDGTNTIQVSDPSGANRRQVDLGGYAHSAGYPVPSPDGRKILFADAYDGNTDIGVFDLDARSRRPLTGPSAQALSTACEGFTRLSPPSWSVARNEIAFTGDCGGEHGLYVYSMDDRLRRLDVGALVPHDPTWSNSGDEIAFSARVEPDRPRDVFVLDLRSGSVEQLTDDGSHGGVMSWSADDRWLGIYGPDGEDWNLYRLRRDGGEKQRLNEDNEHRYYNLALAPFGGESFLYTATDTVYLRESADATPRRVSPEGIYAVMPKWSPDGRRVVFDGNAGDGWELYLIRPDGSSLRRLTHNGEPLDSNASWGPDGERLVFRCTPNWRSTLCILDVATGAVSPLF